MQNRVRELRLERGWTLEKLAELSGLSVSQISNIEKDKRGWSMDSLGKLAEALDVTVVELLDTSRAWQQVPIFGVVEDGGIVKPFGEGQGKKAPRIKAPAAFGDLLALNVVSDGLYPRYLKGDTIFCAKLESEPSECVGQECVVLLEHGESLIRFVYEGTKPHGSYNLAVHNQPPLTDVALVSCRRIIYRTPAAVA